MPNGLKICCGDKNADKITFVCNKTYNGLNLVSVPVYVKTLNQLGGSVKSVLTSTESGDNLLIDWVIDENVTAVNGVLSCQLSFESASGDMVLNSEIFELFINNSLKETGVTQTAEYNHIVTMQNELKTMLNQTVVKIGDNISLLSNDSNYLTQESANELFLSANTASEIYLTKDLADQSYQPKTTKNYSSTHFFNSLKEFVQSANQNAFSGLAGDLIKIANSEITDLYVHFLAQNSVEYTLESEQSFINDLVGGDLQIGYFVICYAKAFALNSLPEVSLQDAGKVLTVSDSGEWVAKSLPLYEGEIAQVGGES